MADINLDRLKKLIPFAALADEQLTEIASTAEFLSHPDGKMLFKREEEDPNVYWLLEGSIDLLDHKFTVAHQAAEDATSAYPFDNTNPHEMTAVSTSEVSILKVARHLVGSFLQGVHSDDFDIRDFEDEVDWMASMLSSPLFEFIPPTNIQKLFAKFEEVKYRRGDVVIRQGTPGDYFYVIQSGRAVVERQAGGKRILVAKLNAGDNFGQDALVTDVARNASVTMTTSGTLQRLSEPDFESLLMHPVIEKLDLEEVREMIRLGDPKTYILDVRNPKETEQDKIDGSLNVPLLLLRKSLPKLKPDAVYVVASDGGKRSELGAYILNENGFTGYVLNQAAADDS